MSFLALNSQHPNSVPPPSSNIPSCATCEMPKDTQFAHGKCSINNEGTLDSNTSHNNDTSLDDKSNQLYWTYNKDTATVLHATGCPTCADWKAHFQDDEDGTLLQACVACEVHICYTLLQPKVDDLRQEWDECCQELTMLHLEEEATEMELEEIQKGTARTQKGEKHIAKLHCKLKNAQYIPPSNASSPQSSKFSHELDRAWYDTPSG